MENHLLNENQGLQNLRSTLLAVKSNIEKVIYGQRNTIDLILVGLITDGHILLEGVPGIAKTLTAKLFAKSLGMEFKRIQFTPDLMPSDVLGTSIFNPKTLEFEYKKGPVFSHFILIDEINRSPAKTQSALFELMEERQVTMDGVTYSMTDPFMVMATQNPIEQEGTYRLPEAQLDRFLLNIIMEYPDAKEEEEMLTHFNFRNLSDDIQEIKPVISIEEIKALKTVVKSIKVEASLISYISSIVQASRNHRHIQLGISPRGGIALLSTSKAFAAMADRDFVIPDDIKTMAIATLRHRMMLTPEAEIEGITVNSVLTELLDSIEIPR